MDNKEIARVLAETGDLMEIDGQDSFRIRSYRNAAQAVETWPDPIEGMLEGKQLTEIPRIGKSMAEHIRSIVKTHSLPGRDEVLKKFPPTILDLLQIRDLGAKRIALIWSTFHAGSVEDVEKLCREGKIRELPRMGEKLEQNILKSITSWKTSAGRFLISVADRAAEKVRAYLE